MTKSLIITIGLPGSGKSTAIKKCFPKAVVISPDHISYDDDGHFDVTRLSRAWKESYARLFSELSWTYDEQAKTIVFDATNLTPVSRGPLIAAGRHFGFEVFALHLKVSSEETKRRNAARSGKDPVPDSVIDIMATQLVEPNAYDPNEFDTVIPVR